MDFIREAMKNSKLATKRLHEDSKKNHITQNFA